MKFVSILVMVGMLTACQTTSVQRSSEKAPLKFINAVKVVCLKGSRERAVEQQDNGEISDELDAAIVASCNCIIREIDANLSATDWLFTIARYLELENQGKRAQRSYVQDSLNLNQVERDCKRSLGEDFNA